MFLADKSMVPCGLIYQLTLKPHAFLQKNISRMKKNFYKGFSSDMIVIYYSYLSLPFFFINTIIVSYDKMINRFVCFLKEGEAK